MAGKNGNLNNCRIAVLIYWIILNITPVLMVSNEWIWKCDLVIRSCERKLSSTSRGIAYDNVDLCRLVCDENGNIWPKPLYFFAPNKELVTIDAKSSTFTISAPSSSSKYFVEEIATYFKNKIDSKNESNCNRDVYKLVVRLNILKPSLKLNWNTNEEYILQIGTEDSTKTVTVTIEGVTAFGVRHGIETFLQLIQKYNDNKQSCHVTLKNVIIRDKPYYKHRGLLLDSARNYLSIDVIKKNIVAMAMSKMNVLHWHLSDTQSFPFVSSSLPNMSSYGAYSQQQTYVKTQIQDLIKFAKVHGVRIIPEIDGPAHAGNGWQWGPDAKIGNLVVCHNQQPYRSYCIQPPCGQMNPANPFLYKILKTLYTDIINIWEESDIFHMGGDEVFIPCWNSSKEILRYINNKRSEDDFLKLWAEYQSKALEAYDIANKGASSSVILWTSTLTDPKHIESFLPKERYVIQTWVPRADPLPDDLIKLGYQLIISTKDSWYLDHGFWGSTSYYTWRNVYDNEILTQSAVLGGEVCMWGELVDDNNIETKVWPRAAAAAERLWTNPSTSSINASSRFFSHNNRLRIYGIRTSPVAPEYCTNSDSYCKGYLAV